METLCLIIDSKDHIETTLQSYDRTEKINGVRLLRATTVDEALEQASRRPYFLVLYERALKARKEASQTPVTLDWFLDRMRQISPDTKIFVTKTGDNIVTDSPNVVKGFLRLALLVKDIENLLHGASPCDQTILDQKLNELKETLPQAISKVQLKMRPKLLHEVDQLLAEGALDLNQKEYLLKIAASTITLLAPPLGNFIHDFETLWGTVQREDEPFMSDIHVDNLIPDSFFVYGNHEDLIRLLRTVLYCASVAMKDEEVKRLEVRCSYEFERDARFAHLVFRTSPVSPHNTISQKAILEECRRILKQIRARMTVEDDILSRITYTLWLPMGF